MMTRPRGSTPPGVKERCLDVLLLLIVLIFLIPGGRVHGYVMPSEQLIQFMAANFSTYETVFLDQRVERKGPGDGAAERVYRERVWLKTPEYCHAEIEGEGETPPGLKDRTFWGLLVSGNDRGIGRLLSRMGIDLRVTAFTRIDGTIAYRIGHRAGETPRVLIEKERFVPLLLVYRIPGDGNSGLVSVRFNDYRKVEKGWFPHEVIVSAGQEVREIHTVLDLRTNIPMDSSIFESPEREPAPDRRPEPAASDPEEERLRKIIRTFEEKYP